MGHLLIQTPTGETIAAAEIPAEQMITVLRSWLLILTPGTRLIVDGVLLSEADKLRVAPAAPTPAPAPPQTQQLTEFAQALHQAFDLIRQGEWELLRHVQQRTREMADESVRQRDLTHRCLRDVDIVDRSILATATTDHFASRIAVASSGPRRLNGHDVLRGVRKVLTRSSK